MEKYLKKLKEINNDKAKNVIKLIEAFNDGTIEGARRETLEDAIELIEAHRTVNDTRELLRNALKARFNDEFGPWIVDHSEVAPLFVIYERDGKSTEQSDYSIDDSHKVTLENPVNVVPRTVYDVVTEAKKNKDGQFDLFEKGKKEAITGDFVQLIESATSEDGTIPIKIIGPGWGSSGYYSEEVLSRDAGIYKEGTKMYWNHPTATEDIERPERSLRDLAAVTVGESYWDASGAAGAGVYSRSKPFSDYAQSIEDMGSDIGLSHIAFGKASIGEAEGQTGRIIESLNEAESVDFVTTAGAGGEIIQLFESARNSKSLKPIKMAENKEYITVLKESNETLRADNQRMKERIALQDAEIFVSDKLKESDLPNITKARILTTESKNIVLDDKGNLDLIKLGETVKEAIKTETEYLAKLSDSGKITGMGSSSEVEEEGKDTKTKESVKKSFETLGFEGKALEIAVNGR